MNSRARKDVLWWRGDDEEIIKISFTLIIMRATANDAYLQIVCAIGDIGFLRDQFICNSLQRAKRRDTVGSVT